MQARVRKWYQLLQTFKKQPDSIEFVYLRHADPDSTQWNPYNIEVVPHAGVKVRGGRVAELFAWHFHCWHAVLGVSIGTRAQSFST